MPSELVLQLQRDMERIDLVAGRIRPKVVEWPLGFQIAVPAIHGDASVVTGDDVVHAILPLLSHGAVQRIDTDEPQIGLEPSNEIHLSSSALIVPPA